MDSISKNLLFASSQPSRDWVRKPGSYAATFDTSFYSFAYSGTSYLAGSTKGLYRSVDGIDWSLITLSSNYSPTVVWANSLGLFVAIVDNKIRTSSNGTIWTTRYTNSTSEFLENIIWQNNTLIVVGRNGRIVRSTNGTSWTVGSNTGSFTFITVAASTNIYVAAGVSNGGRYSTNGGITWNITTSMNLGGTSFGRTNQVIWSNSASVQQFIAVSGDGTISTSSNGASWNIITTPNYQNGKSLNSVTSNTTTCVAVGDSGTILYSTNGGTSWTAASTITNSALFNISWTGQHFVAVGESGIILTSTDGISWINRSSVTNNDLTNVTFLNNVIFLGGKEGTICTSTDAITWLNVLNYHSFIGSSHYVNGKFIVNGSRGASLISNDNGNTWRSAGPKNTGTYRSIAMSSTTTILVGGGGTIYTSIDEGFTWSGSPYANTVFYSVAYSSSLNLFVAVGWSYPGVTGITGGVIYSRSGNIGSAWVKRDNGFYGGYTIRSITWAQDRFYAVANNGINNNGTQSILLSSVDGISWGSSFPVSNVNYSSIAYSNTLNSLVITSTEGIIETNDGSGITNGSIVASISQALNSITWDGTKFYAVGNSGTVLSSSDGVNWIYENPPSKINLYGVASNGTTLLVSGESNNIYTSSTII